MALDRYDDKGDDFLYDCDEVPFDEIPAEPGREISDSGFGELVIRVQKDSINDQPHDDDDDDDDARSAIRGGPLQLQRTIHQVPERVVHPANTFSDDEVNRKRRHVFTERDNYERDVRRTRPFSAEEGRYNRDPGAYLDSRGCRYDRNAVGRAPEQGYPVGSSPSDNHGRQLRSSRQNSQDSYTNDHRGGYRDDYRYNQHNDRRNDVRDEYRDDFRDRFRTNTRDNDIRDNACRDDVRSFCPINRLKHTRSAEPVRSGERKYYHAPDNHSIADESRQGGATSSSQCSPQKERVSVNAPVSSSSKSSGKPLSQRLGPPPKKPLQANRPKPPSTLPLHPRPFPTRSSSIMGAPNPPLAASKQANSRPALSSNKRSTNFIKRNMATSSAARNKQTASNRVGVANSATNRSSSTVKKVATHNPISKAKQKAAPKKMNLQKNIALLTRAGGKANNATAASILTPSPGTGPANPIADLIQGILSEPDVKEMITTIAKQSVPNDEKPSSSVSDLNDDAERILGKANNLLNSKSEGDDGAFFKANRAIPEVKVKAVKMSHYCKECKLEFPSTIMRDIHYKTEMHCFVNGDWWKFNPKPPGKIYKNKFPVSIFCIFCWDLVRAQCQDAFSSHMSSKRHKANRLKFREIFGKLPLYDWCMWSDLSLNFRNSFVPVPSQLRDSMYPEYFYDQRVIKK